MKSSSIRFFIFVSSFIILPIFKSSPKYYLQVGYGLYVMCTNLLCPRSDKYDILLHLIVLIPYFLHCDKSGLDLFVEFLKFWIVLICNNPNNIPIIDQWAKYKVMS